MLRTYRAELMALGSLRGNIWFLSSLVAIQVLFAVGAVAFGSTVHLASEIVGLQAFAMSAAPSFLLQTFFGLFASRAESSLGFESEYLQQPDRAKFWLSRLLATTTYGLSAALLAQFAIWGIGSVALGTGSTDTLNGRLSVALCMLIVQLCALFIGIAASRCVQDPVAAPILLIGAFWLGPLILSAFIGPTSPSAIAATDFAPIQLAERAVWRSPMPVLNFAGLTMSNLSTGLATLALAAWAALAVALILAWHRVERRTKHTRPSPNRKRISTPVIESKVRVKTAAWPLAVRQFMRETYLATATIGDRVVLTLVAALIVSGVFSAAGQVATQTDGFQPFAQINLQQTALFGYSATPSIVLVFFMSMTTAREVSRGDLEQTMLSIPKRFRVWWVKTMSRMLVFSILGLLAYGIAIFAAFATGRLGTFTEAQSLPLAAEAAWKLVVSLSAAVALGCGIGFLTGKSAGALTLALTVLLLLPGVVAAALLATGNANWAIVLFNLLAPNGFSVQHWDASQGVVYQSESTFALNPDEHLLVTATWAMAFALLGLWRLVRRTSR